MTTTIWQPSADNSPGAILLSAVTTPEAARAFLSPRIIPCPPDALPDLPKAVEILDESLSNSKTILIWGDFDVDGQTSTTLLVDAFLSLGLKIAWYIPNRLRESHGIRLDSLSEQISSVRPDVLLTCDTGVSAHDAVDYAKSRGLATLITDHHDLPPTLPDADAVIDPKRLPADHPLASLPGVGVAYKLVEHLYTQYGRAQELPRFLDLVALGIVADVAQQTHDTRYLLQIGLDQLRNTRRIGLQALIEIAGIPPERLNATDIGFQLGPRLNAAGRLDDARPVVELLTTTDPTRARLLALQLEGLNNQRRLLNRQIYAAAQEQIARDPSLLDWEALVLAHSAWHPGIIGIVASRLAEHYQRPVVLLAESEDGPARGSARSVPGYDIGAAVAAQSDLLLSHGGHPGAAGLSLNSNDIPAFRRRLSNTLRETRDPSVHSGLILDAYAPEWSRSTWPRI
jgi:single-stranded-DNA-specific exonuclease